MPFSGPSLDLGPEKKPRIFPSELNVSGPSGPQTLPPTKISGKPFLPRKRAKKEAVGSESTNPEHRPVGRSRRSRGIAETLEKSRRSPLDLGPEKVQKGPDKVQNDDSVQEDETERNDRKNDLDW
jgi:hypothetical protein